MTGLGGVIEGHHAHAAAGAEVAGLIPGHGGGAALPRDVVIVAGKVVVGVATGLQKRVKGLINLTI